MRNPIDPTQKSGPFGLAVSVALCIVATDKAHTRTYISDVFADVIFCYKLLKRLQMFSHMCVLTEVIYCS